MNLLSAKSENLHCQFTIEKYLYKQWIGIIKYN